MVGKQQRVRPGRTAPATGARGEGWGEVTKDLGENQVLARGKSPGRVLQAEETVCKSLERKRLGNDPWCGLATV